jgi:hypothetical protein
MNTANRYFEKLKAHYKERVPYDLQTPKELQIKYKFLKSELKKSGKTINDLVKFRENKELFKQIEEIKGIDYLLNFHKFKNDKTNL